jgi:2-C-methyl-D-erythritol 2,4-cyclodiphosphate synthase
VFRIGQGFDVHKLAENRDLILGGVKIDYPLGLLGHSDADVLTHAVMDALLGALCLGDIGKLFPDTDPLYKGADSIKLLEKVYSKVIENGYTVENLDATVICEKPKILPHSLEMRKNLSRALKSDISKINVKATTTEKLGFTGREEGIASMCVVLLKKN